MLLFSKLFSVRRSILILVILQFVPARPGGNSGSSSALLLPPDWKSTLKAKLKSLQGDYTDGHKRIITNLITVTIYLRGVNFLKKGYNCVKPLPEKSTPNTLTNKPSEYPWYYITVYSLRTILLLSEPEEYLSLMEKILQSIDNKLELWLDNNSEDHKRVYDPEQSEKESFQKEEKDLDKWKNQLNQIWEKNVNLGQTETLKEQDLKDLEDHVSKSQKQISQFLRDNIERVAECMVKQLAKMDVTTIEVYRTMFGNVEQKKKYLKESMELRNAEIEAYVKVFGNYGLEKFKGVKSEELKGGTE